MKKRGRDMIEFKADGPFGEQAQGAEKRLRVIGVGQAGVGSLDQIVMYGLDRYDMLIIDTDQQTLDGSVVKDKLLLGGELTRGLGCGGDYELASEIVVANEEKLKQAFNDCDYAIISLAFGGASSSLIVPQLVKEATRQNVRTIVVGTMPFAFESRRRQAQAMRTVQQLRRCADAVLVFSSDRVTGLPQASGNVRQGFHVLNQFTGHGIESLAQILSKRGLIQLSFADIRSLYGCLTQNSVIENCWAGWSEVSNPRDIQRLVAEALNSPFLAPEVWEQADHAVVCLSGGDNLSLVQVQNVMAEVQKQLPENFSIATGATMEDSCKDKLRLTVLLARTTAPEVPEAEIETADPEVLVHDTVPLPNLAELKAKAAAEEKELASVAETFDDVEAVEETEELDLTASARGKGTKANDADFLIPPRKTKKYMAKQEELPFDASHRGRFEKTVETMYEGENLDQPTFRRRKLAIRL